MRRDSMLLAMVLIFSSVIAGKPCDCRAGEPRGPVSLRRDSSWFAEARKHTGLRPEIRDNDLTVVAGRYSYTEERAKRDAHSALNAAVLAWLAPDIPSSWRVPDQEIRSLIREERTEPVFSDVGKVYLTGLHVDMSSSAKARIYALYDQELVRARLIKVVGGVLFVLVSLAGLAGYIKADEATKGYYTNRLRLVSAAAVGAAGMAIYRIFV